MLTSYLKEVVVERDGIHTLQFDGILVAQMNAKPELKCGLAFLHCAEGTHVVEDLVLLVCQAEVNARSRSNVHIVQCTIQDGLQTTKEGKGHTRNQHVYKYVAVRTNTRSTDCVNTHKKY